MKDFNPRSPCGERLFVCYKHTAIVKFQSTLPVRGATLAQPLNRLRRNLFQSTLPVRGATLVRASYNQPTNNISIHAPRAGSDYEMTVDAWDGGISIHAPRAGSDGVNVKFSVSDEISIHAPRAGSDAQKLYDETVAKTISIHAPRAGSDH